MGREGHDRVPLGLKSKPLEGNTNFYTHPPSEPTRPRPDVKKERQDWAEAASGLQVGTRSFYETLLTSVVLMREICRVHCEMAS